MMLISMSAKPFGSRICYCMWLKSAKIGKFAAGYACMTAERYFMCSSMLPNSKKARLPNHFRYFPHSFSNVRQTG